MIRLRTSIRTNEMNSAAAASKSLFEPLYRCQFSTRCAAMTLPPDTEVMWVTLGENPGVAKKAEQAEVIQTGPEPAAGEGQSKFFHDDVQTAGSKIT